jgi:hypothetical protein
MARVGRKGRQRNFERRIERKAKTKRGGTWFQDEKINSLILVASKSMVSELGFSMSTFVLFGVWILSSVSGVVNAMTFRYWVMKI